MKTSIPKEGEIKRAWRLVDAEGKPAGRLAAAVADMLRGKDKPTYTPHVDTGDFVVVINASKVKLTGRKEDQKIYKSYSGYPSGLKEATARVVRERHPERIVMQAVKGMLPKNHLSRGMLKRLKIYPGAEHPHEAQQPAATELAL